MMGAILAEHNNQLDQAIQQFLMVIRIDPHFGDAHAGLAEVYARQGRFEEAIREIQIGFEYDPDPQYRGSLAKGCCKTHSSTPCIDTVADATAWQICWCAHL